MSKHTPGPWKIDYEPDWPWLGVMAGDEVVVATGASDEPRVRADFALIAAAPDLLAACRLALAAMRLDIDQVALCAYSQAWDQAITAAEAAIAKAEAQQ